MDGGKIANREINKGEGEEGGRMKKSKVKKKKKSRSLRDDANQS